MYEHVLDALYHGLRGTTDGSVLLPSILSVLAVSRDPLTVHELAGVVGGDTAEVTLASHLFLDIVSHLKYHHEMANSTQIASLQSASRRSERRKKTSTHIIQLQPE